MNEHFIVFSIGTCALIAWFFLLKKLNYEPEVDHGNIKKIKIVSCSNPFSWYSTLLKSKEDKIFEVELELTEDGFYRTIEDVAGPGVKGLINPKDTELV